MILAALHFWNSSTSSLHLKCGMLTSTLLDIAAITGLKPTGETFDPSKCKSVVTFNFVKATCGPYVKHQRKPHTKEVSDDEHIDFLTHWLSIYVFCTRSIHVAKHYRALAYQLHEGKPICLSKFILGSLYESLNDGVADMRGQFDILIIPGPIRLFQLWLLATFGSKLSLYFPEDFKDAYDKRPTEGAGLALFRYRENETTQVLFS